MTEYRVDKRGRRYPVAPWLKLRTRAQLQRGARFGPPRITLRFHELRVVDGRIRGVY